MALMEAKVSRGSAVSSPGDAVGGGAAGWESGSGLNRVREEDDLGEKERCPLFARKQKDERRTEVQLHCSCFLASAV